MTSKRPIAVAMLSGVLPNSPVVRMFTRALCRSSSSATAAKRTSSATWGAGRVDAAVTTWIVRGLFVVDVAFMTRIVHGATTLIVRGRRRGHDANRASRIRFVERDSDAA